MSGLGARVAEIYGWWALFLLVGCLGPHLIVLALYFMGTLRSQARRWFVLVELIYGFVNPAVYLLVLQPALFRQWTPVWLPALCWLAWAGYWGTRFFAGVRSIEHRPSRTWASIVLRFAAVLIASLFLRDAVLAATGGIITAKPIFEGLLDNLVGSALCVPLYALPALAVSRQLSSTRSEEAWRSSDFLIWRLPVWVPAVLVLVILSSVVASLQRRSEAEVRALLLQHRETILAVSRERRLDPRLLASIVEVTQRDIDRPFLSGVEEFIADAWLVDSTSGLLLAEAFDPSLGIAQVKAHTMLTAYAIHAWSGPAQTGRYSKHYRSTRVLSREVLERVPNPALSEVRLPEGGALPDKEQIVEALRRPETNLAYSAFLLDLVATQWEAANPTWSIRARPDIMATIFQLGFHKSIPKAAPQPNDFGERVQRAFDDPWMKSQFLRE